MAVRKSENTTLNYHSSHSVIHGHVFGVSGKTTKRLKSGVFKQFSNLLSGNSLISFCTIKFKNIQIFYQNSIAVSETHVYVIKRRRLLPRQRAQVPLELNKRIPGTTSP